MSSIPIPVRYADLCAYRAKLHVEAQHLLDPTAIDEMASSQFDKLNRLVKIHPKVQNQLYYC